MKKKIGIVTAIIGGFDLMYLLILQPFLSTVIYTVLNLASKTNPIPIIQEYIADGFFTGFLRVPYISSYSVFGIILLALIDVVVILLGIKPRPLPNDVVDVQPPSAGNNEYGNTEWLRTPKQITKASNLRYCPINELGKGKSGLYMGIFGEKVFTKTDDGHVLILAPTRMGKTRRILLPMISVLANRDDVSFLIFDPKGELFGVNVDPLKKAGFNVNRIVYSDPELSNRKNPLDNVIKIYQERTSNNKNVAELIKAIEHVKTDVAKKNKPDKIKLLKNLQIDLNTRLSNAENEVDSILSILIKRDKTKEGNGSYFIDGATSLLKMAIHYVCCVEVIPNKARTIERAMKLLTEFCRPVSLYPKNPKDERWFAPLVEEIHSMNAIYPCYKAMKEIDGTRAGYINDFISTATGYTTMFMSYGIAQMSSETDYSFDDLIKHKSATFIKTSLAESTHDNLALFYIDQFYAYLVKKAEKMGGRLDKKVYIIAEELNQLPPITDLDKRLSASASMGIIWVLVLQSTTQLESKYGRENAATIMENCSTHIYLNAGTADTGRYISNKLGNYTIELKGSSSSKDIGAFFNNRTSDSLSLGKRERITADEAQKWNPDQGVIVSISGVGNPIIMPAPKVQDTPFEQIMGYGDEIYEKELRMKRFNEPVHKEKVLLNDWTIELNSEDKVNAVYTDSERKRIRKEYLTKLRNISINRQGDKSKDKSKQEMANKQNYENKENVI